MSAAGRSDEQHVAYGRLVPNQGAFAPRPLVPWGGYQTGSGLRRAQRSLRRGRRPSGGLGEGCRSGWVCATHRTMFGDGTRLHQDRRTNGTSHIFGLTD